MLFSILSCAFTLCLFEFLLTSASFVLDLPSFLKHTFKLVVKMSVSERVEKRDGTQLRLLLLVLLVGTFPPFVYYIYLLTFLSQLTFCLDITTQMRLTYYFAPPQNCLCLCRHGSPARSDSLCFLSTGSFHVL